MIQQSKVTLVTNSIFMIGTYLIAIAGVVLISLGLFKLIGGDNEGFIPLIPGAILLVVGMLFNKLLKKWVD